MIRAVFLAAYAFALLAAYQLGDKCTPSELSSKEPCNNVTLTCDDLTNRCAFVGCRIDEYLDEWPANLPAPPQCGVTEYCPNNRVGCMPKVKQGDICSFGRDDSCEGEVGICLAQKCFLKDVQLGQPCIIDDVSLYLINRDNCASGSFCSTNTRTCVGALENNEPCSEDRQCHSGACRKNICGSDIDYNHFPTWGYIIIGVGCFALLASCILFIYLRRRRRMNAYKKSVAKLENYRRSLLDQSNHRIPSSLASQPVGQQHLATPSNSTTSFRS
ncbi:hypothetical protein K493DRAFT_314271 [Basidiobolus meristosporus CBS 931.73]|uniref:Dickkopf N-terminal cysteine-rich domain-containing protein n=1 Tax=Basidiobolus meristosporus CBS 931.73 TaxID=1314790 RepID=A0A1Y1YG95_9FUNG|nr:hypothetical protein K493DRAFT_314271 [Basidiobolus meristosporus CBS 931.73]|eukprot:ORX96989.1 hypothetical protein K493DRAFT_314271 [Basidiobolus meristosporus CBS 931.73]